ncbi:MAG: 4-alpha-glucanotransferase, partial [Chitinophagaceae bacterium]
MPNNSIVAATDNDKKMPKDVAKKAAKKEAPTEKTTPKKLAAKAEAVLADAVEKKTKKTVVKPTVVAIKTVESVKEKADKKLPTDKPAKAKLNKSAKEKEVASSPKPNNPSFQTKEKETVMETADKSLTITFQIRFHTEYGQKIQLVGNHPILGNNNPDQAIDLQFFNDSLWLVEIKIDDKTAIDTPIAYNYILRNADGSLVYDWGKDKTINPASFTQNSQVLVVDAWNHAGYYENAFYTEPFQNVLLKNNLTPVKQSKPKTVTHVLKVKAPLLPKGQTLCVVGSSTAFGKWSTESPILMSRTADDVYFTVSLNLSKELVPTAYKYGVYDVENNRFLRYEDSQNRILYTGVDKSVLTIVNDGFAVLPNNNWKGSGVAIPVFSLRSNKSFGVGEFADMHLLVDWAKSVGLKLIQILPINDTAATHTWVDSYPYAAISAFALHPMFLCLEQVVSAENKHLLEALEIERVRLNAMPDVDYEAVNYLKKELLWKIYPSQKAATFASTDYQAFFEQNKHWLVPYSVFSYLRDLYGTPDFNQWPQYTRFSEHDVAQLTAPESSSFDAIAINYFIQYHLHVQLKAATAYAHQNGIIVKGDIPIGIYRFGSDAWQNPDLFHMHVQAGAPPDGFAVKGQNWGFPTYNWQRMMQDGFAWWRKRFEQMSHYFDAFRIDHILGFFRIWSIPMHAVEGIMGYFVPAIPIHIDEFHQKGIWFDYHRYTKPFINDYVLNTLFQDLSGYVKDNFLYQDGYGNYNLKEEFNTQRKVEAYLADWKDDDFTARIKGGLFDLISNVILFEVEGSNGQQYHFRFGISSTLSFQQLDGDTQRKLDELYVNYFFRRQDDHWQKEALQKLPALKRVTNMLICGEDLGLVPACVPDVMQQLGLLSLEIQRMPKDPKREFFHPNDAPYLSVVTPSTHDMSTIRGWWEEDKPAIQRFYNNELGQW